MGAVGGEVGAGTIASFHLAKEVHMHASIVKKADFLQAFNAV